MTAGVADRLQLAQKIGRRVRSRTALVVKANLIRHRMVAEDDRQVVFALAELPGTVKQLGMTNITAAIPTDLAPGRATENLLVGGDPFDAVAGEQRDQGLAHRALAGPHSPRRRSESPLVAFHCAADMNFGVLGITLTIRRQGHIGHGLASEFLVQQQGENRVVVGRRGQLDLSPLGQSPVQVG